MKTLAERLIHCRTEKGLSQADLARLSGVAQSTIGNLEAGLRQSPRRIASIANALSVNTLWLFEGLGQKNAAPPQSSVNVEVAMDSDLGQDDESFGRAVHLVNLEISRNGANIAADKRTTITMMAFRAIRRRDDEQILNDFVRKLVSLATTPSDDNVLPGEHLTSEEKDLVEALRDANPPQRELLRSFVKMIHPDSQDSEKTTTKVVDVESLASSQVSTPSTKLGKA